MKKIVDGAAYLFIISTFVLTIISIFGVWDVLGDDVIGKSFQTLGLLSVVSIIVIAAGKFVDSKKDTSHINVPAPLAQPVAAVGEPSVAVSPQAQFVTTFTLIRHITLGILVAAVGLLALIGVLSIWDVLVGEIVEKSFVSIAIIAFSSFLVVMTCLEREDHELLHRKRKSSIPGIVLFIIFVWLAISFIGLFV